MDTPTVAEHCATVDRMIATLHERHGVIAGEFVLYADDETAYWDEAWRAEHGIERVYTVYLTDLRTHIHLCEMAASLRLEPLYTEVVLRDDIDDPDGTQHGRAWDAMNDEQNCETLYLHARDVEAALDTPKTHYVGLAFTDTEADIDAGRYSDGLQAWLDQDTTDEEVFDALREHYQGNYRL